MKDVRSTRTTPQAAGTQTDFIDCRLAASGSSRALWDGSLGDLLL